ncbi:hypothetical protein Pmar_PMAR024473 [Perkinsus marinus ATCC 50983]|uniref:Uncharacterized protein n=1 Tax=Perkinsus marinus (strain ATCC 50983 / TXsc) TaxID=423536 RepID=C5LT27_PERM5|nr:hypothetical protein Pmar_PMAR024473 [Perkinsus marinus ATCC 50983]EEQ99994.1 hypothetical protein Pmar_PMAR024473 [Perkinsus marinus ATCC 50983]|eukprot:XP_002767277.1 hypothetical protein Pmar_PMAR024473 [Perkinsus marinus ATCC 50983]
MPGPPEEGDPEEEIPLSGLAQLVVSPKDWWSESVVEEFMTTVEPSFPSLGRSSHFLQKGISRRRHRMLALRLAAVALMTVVALSLFFGTRSLQNRRRAITQDLETLDSTRLVALLDELLGPNARMKAERDGQW